MSTIAFILTMRCGWQQGDVYAIVRSFRNGWPTVNGTPVKDYHAWSFGDGWVAAVTLREVDRNEASRLRRASKGFHGYDWMVETILEHGRIMGTLTCSVHGKQTVAAGWARCPVCVVEEVEA